MNEKDLYDRIDKLEKEAVEARERLDSISDCLGDAATRTNSPSDLVRDLHLKSDKFIDLLKKNYEEEVSAQREYPVIGIHIVRLGELLDDIETLRHAVGGARRAFMDAQNDLVEIQEVCEDLGYDEIKDWLAKLKECLVINFKKE